MSAAARVSLLHARPRHVPGLHIERPQIAARIQASAEPAPRLPAPSPQLAFYRKYTSAMLRRYVRMSLEVGRVPSLLGRELFRAKVTSYRVESFEDVVIFCHDVERCLQRLSPGDQYIVDRMALKEYTVCETAELLSTDPRGIVRRYNRAIDRLTAIFLEFKLLDLQKSCQAPKTVENSPTLSNESEYKSGPNSI
jgi:hypothetical protein